MEFKGCNIFPPRLIKIYSTSGTAFHEENYQVIAQTPKSKSNEHRRRLAEHQWTLDIASQDITENIGAIVSQNEWTLNITAQAITEKVGVAVTQKTNTGILKTALSNEWTLAITSQEINEISGVAVTQGDATGTLKTALTGASTSVVIETASDVTFLNSSNVLYLLV